LIFSPSEILPVAQSTGFRADMVEKVAHLLRLLDGFNAHPFLKGKWVLKGGTALNLFLADLPRLSVDIDLNYTGALGRDEMLAERPGIEQACQAVFSREGFAIKKVPADHAGGKWRLQYRGFSGRSGNLEVDLNFMYRQPLWDVLSLDSRAFGDFQAKNVPVLDLHELAAGKLAALFARGQARDLFDCHRILQMKDLDAQRLRIAFVVYGAMNRKDWRTVSLEDVGVDAAEIARKLLPTLRGGSYDSKSEAAQFGERLVRECRSLLSAVLPFSDSEKAFLDRLLDDGVVDASILTPDENLRQGIGIQPLLEWKAVNVRKHRGLS